MSYENYESQNNYESIQDLYRKIHALQLENEALERRLEYLESELRQQQFRRVIRDWKEA